jgi:hypothetical protein
LPADPLHVVFAQRAAFIDPGRHFGHTRAQQLALAAGLGNQLQMAGVAPAR